MRPLFSLFLDFSLFFPSPGSVANYVEGDRSIVNLSKLSVCFWVKSTRNRNTVFSHLGTRETKELELEIYDTNYVTFTVGGGEARQENLLENINA